MPSQVDDLEAAAQVIAENMNVVRRVADECKTYYTSQVNAESVVHWLLQFREPSAVQIALRLLERVHFVDEIKLGTLLKVALDKVPEEHRRRAIFVPAGKSHDSSAHVSYSLSKALSWPEEELAQRWRQFTPDVVDALIGGQQMSALILVDDNITSGTQLERLLQELFPSFVGEREHFAEAFPGEVLVRLKSIPIHVVVAVELSDGVDRVVGAARKLELNVSVHSGYKDHVRWLDYGGPIWTSPEHAGEAKRIVTEISRGLLADKGWSTDVLENRVLGYGNLQKLTVFQYNVPKALLPPFWKSGRYRGAEWYPLFAERAEWQQRQAQIQGAAPFVRMMARLVSSGAYGRTAPSITAAISIDGSRQTELSFLLPDEASVNRATYLYLGQLPRPKPMHVPEDQGISAFGNGKHSPATVRLYNSKVKSYIERLEQKYSAVLLESVVRAGRLMCLPIRVYNEGTRKATLTLLQLELVSGVSWVPKLPVFPFPPEPPEPPKGAFDLASASLVGSREQTRLLQRINENLSSGRKYEERTEEFLKLVRDQGRVFLNVHYGGVLQGTFRDRDVEYLRFDAEGRYVIPYRLLCEESPRPVEGAFVIDVVRGPMEPVEVFDSLVAADEEDGQ